MAATLGMMTALWGLAALTIEEPSSCTRRLSLSDTPLVCIAAAMFVVVLFNFIEFDLPTAQWLALALPGLFYSVTLTTTLVFFFVLLFAETGIV